jgi:hypothetical protein
MRDLILVLGALGFALFGMMLTVGIVASGVMFWINLFS